MPMLSLSIPTLIFLRSAAFELEKIEVHDEALTEMVQQIRMKLLSAEVLVA